MPKINLSKVDDAASLAPAGQHVCAVTSVKVDETKGGDEMWRVRFKVVGGEHAGEVVLDNLVFSDAAMSRIKLACKAFGIDTSKEVELNPSDILGLMCLVTVVEKQYEDKRGRPKVTVGVSFDGYRPLPEDEPEAEG
jgi:hypothetical protein